jgi:type I restriction enzyme S subunit
MNKIERLIAELCPQGVTFVSLGLVGEISSNGVDKKSTLGEAEVNLLNYMDVYRNSFVDDGLLKMKVTAKPEQISKCNILKGDLFFTPTSETPDDIGHASVAQEDVPLGVFSYHLHRIRFHDFQKTEPNFIRHLFRSSLIQKQIRKSTTGMTRFGLSKRKWEEILVPLPPLAVQREIVSILDKFTELEARSIQYEALRRDCFRFQLQDSRNPFRDLIEKLCPSGLEVRDLGDCVTENVGGGTPSRARDDFWNGEIPWASVGDITSSSVSISKTRQTISDLGLRSSSTKIIPAGHVIVAVKINPGAMRVVMADMAINQDIRGLLLRSEINPYFLTYYFKTLSIASNGTIVQGITNATLLKVKVPVPPMAIQNEIVNFLDSLSGIVTSLDRGLPAEITARRQQYDYYRNKLLTFKELKAS